MRLPRWVWPFGRASSQRSGYEFDTEPDETTSRDSWRPRETGPKEITWDFKLTRSRCLDLVQSNPHAAAAMGGIVNTLVGTGISPRGRDDVDEWANTEFGREFMDWADDPVDIQGQHNFWSCQTQVGNGFGVCEAFVQRVPAKMSDGLRVPLMLRLHESHMLEDQLTRRLDNGNEIRAGIELDPRGRRVAYHFYKEHPGDRRYVSPSSSLETVRVPAQDVAHFFWHGWRLGGLRGGFWLRPVVTKLRDLDDFDDAELVRKKIEACFSVVVNVDSQSANKSTIGPYLTDSRGKRIETIEPGIIAYTRGSGEVKSFAPSSTAGAENWRKSHQHTIAAGLRVPYAVMTGDLRDSNFANSRMGYGQFYRSMSVLQHNIFIPGMTKILRWWLAAADVAGRISKAKMRVGWMPPKFDSPNPTEDARAVQMRVRNGQTTLAMEISADGNDPSEVWNERAKEIKTLAKLGVVTDSDPSKTMAPGGAGAVAYTDPDKPPS